MSITLCEGVDHQLPSVRCPGSAIRAYPPTHLYSNMIPNFSTLLLLQQRCVFLKFLMFTLYFYHRDPCAQEANPRAPSALTGTHLLSPTNHFIDCLWSREDQRKVEVQPEILHIVVNIVGNGSSSRATRVFGSGSDLMVFGGRRLLPPAHHVNTSTAALIKPSAVL